MSNLVVLTFIRLDGVMQAPGGPEEDPAAGFRHGGWVFPCFEAACFFALLIPAATGSSVFTRLRYVLTLAASVPFRKPPSFRSSIIKVTEQSKGEIRYEEHYPISMVR